MWSTFIAYGIDITNINGTVKNRDPTCKKNSQQILSPTPATCLQVRTEVVLQVSESCTAELALQNPLLLQSGRNLFYPKLYSHERKIAL